MKKKADVSKHKEPDADPYPGSLVVVLIALIATVYALLPLPPELLYKWVVPQWFTYSFAVIYTVIVTQFILIQHISRWFDKKYQWEGRILKRMIVQVLTGWSSLAGVSVPISWFWFRYLDADEQSIRYAYNAFMFKNISDSAAILNAVYLLLSFYGHYQRSGIKKEQKNTPIPVYPNDLLLFNSATKTETRVPVSDIAYICLVNKRTLVLRQNDGSSLIFWDKLENIKSHLDPNRFCKVNRTCIVGRHAIINWSRCADRGIILNLSTPPDEPVKVSRDRVAEVISWIKSRAEVSSS